MNLKKKTAFIYGRPQFNSAKLLYMPFGLNVVKKLAEKVNVIDLYVTQDFSDEYKKNLPENVSVVFLDNKAVWGKGTGRSLFYLLNFYFRILTQGKKYDSVWGIGQAGTVLGGKLAQRQKVPFYYLSDEFPDISYLQIWRENEKKYASTSKFFIVPDESRLEVTRKQIPALKTINGYTLPNIPLQNKPDDIDTTDWKKKLNLRQEDKLIVYAGGIEKENNIDYMMIAFSLTPPEYVLIMVGENKKYSNDPYLANDRIKWIKKPLTDGELHGLILQSIGCVCYYADFADLRYVGKSSGKIMRSLLLGVPVIASDFESLKFIEHDDMGVLISKPGELVSAVIKLDKNRDEFKAGIKTNIHKYLFEAYWKKLEQTVALF